MSDVLICITSRDLAEALKDELHDWVTVWTGAEANLQYLEQDVVPQFVKAVTDHAEKVIELKGGV